MQAIASPPAFSCCSASSVSSFRRHQPPSALAPCSGRRKGSSRLVVACLPSSDPLIVQAARGEAVSRPPAWIMRQAGRYMAGFRKLAEQHQSFRKMSETVDLIVEVTLLPWNAFHPDGVIIFSDILTPLPAIGIPFGIDAKKGPFIQSPIRSKEQLKNLNRIDLDKLDFVGKSLGLLRKEVGEEAAVLGFVGAPWTLATYIIEGETSTTHANIKCMSHTAPDLLNDILSHLTKALTEYIIYQIKAGAQYIQIFDSWGGQLPPNMWDIWSKPYIAKMVTTVKKAYPQIPLALYLTGSGGLLEKMQETGVDVIGLDWTVDMTDGRRRLGDAISIQGNIDPLYLFSPLTVVSEEILRVVQCAGPKGHILNLGRGIMPNTPEDTVAHFFETVRDLSYDKIFGDSGTEQQPKSAKQTHKVPVKQ